MFCFNEMLLDTLFCSLDIRMKQSPSNKQVVTLENKKVDGICLHTVFRELD